MNDLLTTAEVAEIEGVTKSCVRNWCNKEMLPCITVKSFSGRPMFLIKRSDIGVLKKVQEERRKRTASARSAKTETASNELSSANKRDGLLTTADVAEIEGKTKACVHGWIRNGKLPYTMGRSAANRPSFLIKRSDLEAFKRRRAAEKQTAVNERLSTAQREAENGRFTVKQVSKMCGMPASTIAVRIGDGRLEAEMVKRAYYITQEAIDAMMFAEIPIDAVGNKMIDVSQAAERMGVDKASVRRLIRKNGIASVSHNKKYFLEVTAVDNVISERAERKRIAAENKKARAGRSRLTGSFGGNMVTTAEAAVALGVRQQAVTNMCQAGTLKAQRVGRRWAIDKNSLARLVSKRKAENNAVEERRVAKKRGKNVATFASGGVAVVVEPVAVSHKKKNKAMELADNRAAISRQETAVRERKVTPIFLPAGVKSVNDKSATKWRPWTADHKRRHGVRPLASAKEQVHVLGENDG